ncbi:alpha/beta hydrolase [Microbacterium sp. zg.Y1090]|uniref:alpha/beta hydrolase n=1 Tax=Microbacterium TaxID=33882 RepID=UPI00214AA73B|nr:MULTISPECIES: alpha/beta hydrolase [unclassified Microbacterium]MCR2813309.1 alpha/beta hydrolase [Microbacterium sp. zg.Y1084]MCR2819857.1 alpha/beta hydrolase [Microbacterium sp. zg.Y1090]MDL5487968.1 alpha/beta hydrolase [Microbacterium sp. zg-Y1211]WIM28586.1 alpha/beta hydrolase [Microbacterium sp. zg-Y1090]
MDATQRMLALLNEGFPDITALEPHRAREVVDARVRPADNLDDVESTADAEVDAGGHRVPVRVYRPRAPRPGAPVTVYAHGGGFLHGSIASHDGFCRRWAKGTGSVVVSVGYRLSPEHRPPAARDDIVAAVDWSRRTGLAGDGVILAGDSSGATLAALATRALRDRGDSPVVGQVLLYPFLDPTMSSASHVTRGQGYFVTSALLSYYWRSYLGPDADPAAPGPAATPWGCTDAAGQPSSIVVTAGLDPLCDEGTAYAAQLRLAGNHVLERRYPDQFHGFLTIAGHPPAASALDVLWADIRTLPTPTAKDHR